ncbi:Enoyl-CoA hydratase/carnithine racemase [Paramagnetospirillum magneticum AMB-1]|uniref:Enoyl-CoA hydratase/carnithine racemase n=2 Tax=Paramagnetospirillum magneticum TaxID=84159 RepID=Q2W9G1_PARM1|nr:Enoyl-CoA hydratase/carnithine racemase [Paramagnetospirillum magneticum AMB-1]
MSRGGESMTDHIHVKISGAVATVTLRRPELHNALDEQMVGNLAQTFQKLSVAEAVRVVVIEGQGPSFCAGGDIGWTRAMLDQDAEEVSRSAMQMAVMLDAIDRCAKPVIARVQGAALGMGAGIVSVADMVVAADDSSFSLPEVRAGFPPTLIMPYLAAAMGTRAMRRYVLSGERFDAREALRLGLIHAVVAGDKLDSARDLMVESCLKGAPKAQGAAKDMLRVVDDSPAGPDLMRYTVAQFVDARAGAECREGVLALTEKRKPNWSV